MRTLLHWLIMTVLASISLGFLVSVLVLSIVVSFGLLFVGLIVFGLAALDDLVTNGNSGKLSKYIIASVRGS